MFQDIGNHESRLPSFLITRDLRLVYLFAIFQLNFECAPNEDRQIWFQNLRSSNEQQKKA